MLNVINYNNGFAHMYLLHGISSVAALIFMMYCVPTNQMSSKKLHTSHHHTSQHALDEWVEGLRVAFGALSVFVAVAIMGFCMAFLENFCYISIRQLYTKHDLMEVAGRDISLYRVFYSLGGTLVWWFSGSWNKRLGPDVVMFASVCCLPLCFFLYSGVGSGLDGLTRIGFLLAEAIRSAVFAASWNAATLRVNELSPRHSSMLQTMLEATYRGVGHASGSYFGMCAVLF